MNPLEWLVTEAQARPLPDGTRRDLRLPALRDKADVVIGMRRSGKTWFLYQVLRSLVAEGTPRSRILFAGFDDDRLHPLTLEDLSRLPELFFARNGERDQTSWFLFDEIQEVPGWELFVRRLLDTENIRLVLTGSSARLLSREIATTLRGRSLSSTLLPFSFREALRHAGNEPTSEKPRSAAARSTLEHGFLGYLESGGFPEVQGLEASLRRRVLQEYVDVLLFRDVVERHGVTNLTLLRTLVRRVLRNPAGRMSVNRLHKDLTSMGVPASKDTVHEYLGHFEDAHLCRAIWLRTSSERRRMIHPRKIYLIDHALTHAVRFPRPEDVGHRLENIVFVELWRRGCDVTYHLTESGYEIDFVAETPDGDVQLLQVCAELRDPETRTRELRALEEGMTELKLDRAWIVTLSDDQSIQLEAGPVTVIPAWRWLLGSA